jgi:hypothetical protein
LGRFCRYVIWILTIGAAHHILCYSVQVQWRLLLLQLRFLLWRQFGLSIDCCRMSGAWWRYLHVIDMAFWRFVIVV